MKFRPDNNYIYTQDLRWHRGIPSGVDFQVFRMRNSYKLIAPGYGSLDGNGYGNGAIFVDSKTSKKLKKRLEAACTI